MLYGNTFFEALRVFYLLAVHTSWLVHDWCRDCGGGGGGGGGAA